jgi:large subunit ribosomal protein L29
MLKVRQLRDLTRDELLQKKNDLLDEQFNLNMRKSLKALDNPVRLRYIRREIAQVETLLHEDKLGLNKLAQTKVSILDDGTKSAKKDKE